MISLQLPAIVGGLQDASDDVRGVAAAALLTVTDSLAKNFSQQVDMHVFFLNFHTFTHGICHHQLCIELLLCLSSVLLLSNFCLVLAFSLT